MLSGGTGAFTVVVKHFIEVQVLELLYLYKYVCLLKWLVCLLFCDLFMLPKLKVIQVMGSISIEWF